MSLLREAIQTVGIWMCWHQFEMSLFENHLTKNIWHTFKRLSFLGWYPYKWCQSVNMEPEFSPKNVYFGGQGGGGKCSQFCPSGTWPMMMVVVMIVIHLCPNLVVQFKLSAFGCVVHKWFNFFNLRCNLNCSYLDVLNTNVKCSYLGVILVCHYN